MPKLWLIFLFFQTVYVINCKVNVNLLNGIIKLIKHTNVHTVWTSTCWDISNNIELLTRLSTEDISITFNLQEMTIKNQTHNKWYKSGVLVDLACSQTSNVLQQASNNRLFNLQNEWILFDRYGNPNNSDTPTEIALQTFRKHISQFFVLPDSRVYLMIEIDNNNIWEVWDGFRVSVADEIRVSKVGTVTSDEVEIKYSDRTNFQRVTLKASTVILEPREFTGWNKPINIFNLDSFAHMHYAIISVLTEQLNFTLNLTIAQDYGWSYGNGTYSGLMGQLQREDIDFTATGALMRLDRMDVGDVTVGTFVARTLAIFRQPPLSSVNNIFTLPFALRVWILMFIVVFVFIVVLIFFTWTSNRLQGRSIQFSTTLDTVSMVLGAICQQGVSSTTIIHYTSVRLATFMLFLFAVFLFTSYAASIVTLLESTSKIIKDVKDLADKPITFSVQDTRHNYIYLNETLDKNIRKVFINKIKPYGKEAFTNPEVGIERVRNEFHSFLGEITLAYNIIAKTWKEHEKCSLAELELYKIPLLTIYVVKNSGHKDLFKQKIIQQNEIGLKYRIIKNTMPQKQKCDSANSGMNNFNSISLKEIYPALLFLSYGICVSLILFVIEHIFKIEKTKSNNK